MTDKEYNKMIADVRRSVSHKYGFRQSSYVNFKVESGYFFCLYFLTGGVRLTVKPMYADDLWWNIWDASDNKNEPLSLRGTGAYSLSGQILTSDEITKVADKGELTNIIDGMFKNATDAISKFIIANPNADTFFLTSQKWIMTPTDCYILWLLSIMAKRKMLWQLSKKPARINIDVFFKAECSAIATHISAVGATVNKQPFG